MEQEEEVERELKMSEKDYPLCEYQSVPVKVTYGEAPATVKLYMFVYQNLYIKQYFKIAF